MTQRQQWIDDLQHHRSEVERLSRAVRELDEAARRYLGPCAGHDERTRRQIEHTTAELIRHEISMALLSSRLASPLAS